jgi:cytochrome P450
MMDHRVTRFPLGHRIHLAELSANPYPLLCELQQHEPVSWVSEVNQWYVTRRADMEAILLDHETFTLESSESLLDDTIGRMMLSTDGADHHRLRQPFHHPSWNVPRPVRATMSSVIESCANHLIDQFVTAGEVDLHSVFADRLALQMVTQVLGLPIHNFAEFRGWFTDIGNAFGNYLHDPNVRERGRTAAAAFCEFARPHLAQMRTQSNDSVLSHALHESDLSEAEILSAAQITIFGGLETTAALLSNTVWALLTHLEQFAMVRADLSLLKNVVEESLRWEPPVQTLTRQATRDVVVRDVTIAEGEVVQCMIGAANRDPTYFVNPDAFDIHRANARDHLSFAIGKHYCLGAALARLEGELGLRVLFERLPHLRLDLVV